LESLRSAHSELLKRFRSEGATPEMIAEVESFIRLGKATGALLDDENDRWTAQSQLDYWATQLYQPGHEPPDSTLDEFDPLLAPEIDDSACPYMGLDAFRESNQSVFFGRSRLIDQLIEKLRTSRFLVVLGSSGSGKSSLVRAGLIPALKKGIIPGSEDWVYCEPIVPGSNPLENLAHTVQPLLEYSVGIETVINRLQNEPDYLAQLLAGHSGNNVVVIIDQFEEVFTLCTNEALRNSFVANLMALFKSTDSNHRVIVTMRSDFEANVARLPDLQKEFDQNSFRITPFGASELRETIEAPAALVGLKFEQGVVDALLNDILGEPAALPLLQFTLLKLWENRDRNRVTWDTYRKLGGGRQALAHSADEFYNGLIHEDQVTMRRILLKMVRPGEGLEVTSSRIRRSDLYQKAEASDRIDRVLDKLIKERLVRVSEGDSNADDQVEIAHEALVRNWPRLVDWLEEERGKLRQRQRLTTAAEEWRRLNYATAALWRRELLEEALRYDDLNELESQFVNTSNSRQRRWNLAKFTGIVILIALLFLSTYVFWTLSNVNATLASNNAEFARAAQEASIFAVEQQRKAEENAANAMKQRNLALASRLASQAQLILETQKSKRETAVLLAIRSMQMNPSAEAAQILRDIQLPIIQARIEHGQEVYIVAVSPDGKYVASGSEDDTARVWEIATGKELAQMPHDSNVTAIAFSPDGEFVLSGDSDGIAILWKFDTGEKVAQIAYEGGEVRTVAFSHDGRFFASGGCDYYYEADEVCAGGVHVASVETGKEVFTGAYDFRVNKIDFSPDGESVLSAGGERNFETGALIVWDVETGEEIERIPHDNEITSAAFSPDGNFVVTGRLGGIASVWDVETGKLITQISHEDDVMSVAFSPSGEFVASGSADGQVIVWSAFNDEEQSQVTHAGPIRSVAFSPDGQYILSGGDDGTAILSIASSGEIVATMSHGGVVNSVAFGPDGKFMVSGGCDLIEITFGSGSGCFQGNIRVWNLPVANTGIIVRHDDAVISVAVSPDSTLAASGGYDGTARIWKVDTGEEVGRITLPEGGAIWSVAFSPNSQFLAAGGCDEFGGEPSKCIKGIVYLLELSTGKVTSLQVHDNWVNSVAFSPDNHFVLSGGDDASARLWDLYVGEEVLAKSLRLEKPLKGKLSQENPSLPSSVWDVAFRPQGDLFAIGVCDEFSEDGAACVQGSMRVIKLSTLQEILVSQFSDWVWDVAFSPNGNFVLAGSYDTSAAIYEIRHGEPTIRVRFIQDTGIRSVALNSDGSLAVTGGENGIVQVWEVATREQVAQVIHADTVFSVAFSPDDSFVLSASGDGTARAWDAHTGDQFALVTHENGVRSAVFSPDGEFILTGGDDSIARVSSWQPASLIHLGCSGLTRNLTSVEWNTYFKDEPYQAICPNLPTPISVDLIEEVESSLLDYSDPDRVNSAVELAVDGIGSKEQATNLVELLIRLQVEGIDNLDLQGGEIEPAIVILSNAGAIELELADVDTFNRTCWFGSIYGYEEDVLEYCEQAVALAPTEAAFIDSRGLARALTGDYSGAVADFQYFVDNYDDPELVNQRREWIEALKAGKDPFTTEVLEMLKGQ
jgi:WD40 repeat protein